MPEELNINKMYELFLAKNDDVKVSYESYRTIFNRDFNISFGYPRTDTCSKCDEFKIRIDKLSLDVAQNPQDAAKAAQLNDLKIERDLHQRKAGTFYRRKKDARLRAKTTPDMEAFTFDFQKNLNIPNKSTNDFYYHRKLTFQSFNIHQLSTNDVHMYCYDETVAKKGSDDVASMLYHHFMNNVPEHVRHINLFCDSCAGQNKNYTIIRFMDYLVHYKKRFDSVTVTFPERGHSYMECDRDMGLINTKAPTSVPSDWMEEFRRARKNQSPFSVVEVTKEIILNFTDTLKPLYKKGCPVPTRPLREIRFNIQDPGVMSHRDTWNGNFLRTNIHVVVGRRTRPPVPGELKQLYKDRLPISTAKFKDLQILKRFSSDEAFFDALPYDDRKEDADDDDSV